MHPDDAATPEFFLEGIVKVADAEFCERGVYLFFVANQSNVRRKTCFEFAEPSLEQYLKEFPPDSFPTDDQLQVLHERLAAEQVTFRQRVDELRSMLDVKATGGDSFRFGTGLFTHPPKLYLGSTTSVRWNGRKTDLLNGSFNVYFGPTS